MADKIDAHQSKALRESYPKLQVRGEGPRELSGVALASKNIKRLLASEFPGVKFSVTSSIYSGGNSVYVSWMEFEGKEKLRDKVDELIYPFGFGRYDGMTDCSSTDQDPDRRAFRSLFGGAQTVLSQPDRPSPAEQAAYDAKNMNVRTRPATAPRKIKEPGRF